MPIPFWAPRSMGKIGLLYLMGGQWKGQQILDPGWINYSWTTFPTIYPGIRYGYFWWHQQYGHQGKQIDAYYADGWGQQYIICIPELNLVVAIIGSNYNSPFQVSSRILNQFVLPAVK